MPDFHKTRGYDEWLTPPSILNPLGTFDLDPCSPIKRPWATAKNHFTIEDNGLRKQWEGRVWLNPPYGAETPKWLGRLAEHGNGIALVHARTDTRAFQDYVFNRADAVLFMLGRINFFTVEGKEAKFNSGAATALAAYGKNNLEALELCKIAGVLIYLT